MLSHFLSLLWVGAGLSLVQCLAALPWTVVLLSASPRDQLRRSSTWTTFLASFAAVAVALALLLYAVKESSNLKVLGKVYGSLLHAQLLADLFVAFFALLLAFWPKGGAVALSAFREGVRQPLFVVVVLLVLLFQVMIPVVPYFTLGEDHLMARDLGLEVIMIGAVLFCVLQAAMSISEEIEGRTAVTLMSKPVSRRQFLLGKFLGILAVGLLLTTGLGWAYCWMIDFKHYFDSVHWYSSDNPTVFPASLTSTIASWVSADEGQAILRGAAVWGLDATDALPGVVLGFCHVMVLLAAAVCLATRLPVAANVVICFVFYVLGHLTPTIKAAAQVQAVQAGTTGVGSLAAKMLGFVAQVFELVLPGLELFSPTRVTDVPIATIDLVAYAGQVGFYTLLYTVVLLLFGLILFEDRDLA